VISIGASAFKVCTGLTSVNIGNSVTSIGALAFYFCTGLTNVIIPNSVTSIGNSAFADCQSLTSVSISNSITSIEYYVFYNCSRLNNVNIPNSVTSIGNSAFYSCASLSNINIPNSLISIGDSAFNSCDSLTSFNIPNSVTSIGEDAFNYCRGLTSVIIPNSVTSIGSSAFQSCYNLKSITCAITKPLTIDSTIFSGVTQSSCCLIVPTNSVSSYKSASIWQNFLFTCGTLHTDTFVSNKNIKIYPNPVQNELLLELHNTTTKSLEIVDTNGKKLIHKAITTPITTVDTSNLTSGIYFVNVISEEGDIITKFIKK
jgi:putative transposon-encoded protein